MSYKEWAEKYYPESADHYAGAGSGWPAPAADEDA